MAVLVGGLTYFQQPCLYCSFSEQWLSRARQPANDRAWTRKPAGPCLGSEVCVCCAPFLLVHYELVHGLLGRALLKLKEMSSKRESGGLRTSLPPPVLSGCFAWYSYLKLSANISGRNGVGRTRIWCPRDLIGHVSVWAPHARSVCTQTL